MLNMRRGSRLDRPGQGTPGPGVRVLLRQGDPIIGFQWGQVTLSHMVLDARMEYYSICKIIKAAHVDLYVHKILKLSFKHDIGMTGF